MLATYKVIPCSARLLYFQSCLGKVVVFVQSKYSREFRFKVICNTNEHKDGISLRIH